MFKKLFVLILFSVSIICVSCDDSEEKTCIKVNFHYTGTDYVGMLYEIWIDLFSSMEDIPANPIGGLHSWNSQGTGETPEMAPGTYYAVAYYDNNGNDYLSPGDSFIIYNGQTEPVSATPIVVVKGKTTTISLTFDDSNLW